MQGKLLRFVPRGLEAQLALAFSLLSIVLTIALVALFERRAIAEIETQIGEGLADLAAQTSDKLERGMFERYREVALIARQAVSHDPAQADADRAAALALVQRSYTYYEWLGIADVKGKVLASGNNLLVGVNVAARPWFREGLRGGFVGDVHEALLLDKLLPPQASGPRRFVDVAFPFADATGEVQGVLGAHLSWNWAREVERSVTGSVARHSRLETLILSSKGVVLLGPSELVEQTLDLQSFRRATPTRQGDFLVEDWPDGKKYLVGFQKGTGYASYPGLGWVVMVRQDLDEAYAPVYALRAQLLFGGIALALLFSLAGVWVARRITRPLKQLASSAGDITGGGAVQIESGQGGYEEVRALSRSLNALVADLDERRRQLQVLNGTLEEVVEARTLELRRALDTVRISEARIRAIVETAQDAFIGIDLAGSVIEWNRQAEQLLGWRRDEAIGKPLTELMLPERFRPVTGQSGLAFLDEHGGVLDRRVERIVTDRHGAEIPVEMSSGLTGQGDGTTFSIFLRDITERKRIDRAKNEFVGTVSHELRTPLTSIRASLELLAAGALGPVPPDMLELVEICHANCIRLNRLVDDMLDIQKIEAGMMSFKPVLQPVLPLAREAQRTMRGMATARDVTLVLDCAPGAETLEATFDYDRMTQVMTNLLSNAIKVAPPGSPVLLQVVAEAGGARLSVCDRGPGVPPEMRERVFQPFVQIESKGQPAASGGTGLGLAICRRIVEEHGGTVTIEDAPGGGAVFSVRLPHGAMPALARPEK
ncbi:MULTISPECIES: ATP-binding protein [unclassified Massilia]|uniref:sensor histidine kinase n=1 Tax=unclassified Massilia TaxID=2609279 RepID=UPI001781C845|nr:PAS domain S-box protein [Massilia sp. CFBP 13647]MBD8671757.1 PAS domain S-box protein [Massilia sp. CFBP 13721]